jgi:precorrin-6x reductase
MNISAVGMVWYRREHFDQLRALCEDGDKLPRTYEEWLARAEQGRKFHEERGAWVICVHLDPEEFPAWCLAQGLHLNADARNRFAAEVAHAAVLARQQHGKLD